MNENEKADTQKQLEILEEMLKVFPEEQHGKIKEALEHVKKEHAKKE